MIERVIKSFVERQVLDPNRNKSLHLNRRDFSPLYHYAETHSAIKILKDGHIGGSSKEWSSLSRDRNWGGGVKHVRFVINPNALPKSTPYNWSSAGESHSKKEFSDNPNRKDYVNPWRNPYQKNDRGSESEQRFWKPLPLNKCLVSIDITETALRNLEHDVEYSNPGDPKTRDMLRLIHHPKLRVVKDRDDFKKIAVSKHYHVLPVGLVGKIKEKGNAMWDDMRALKGMPGNLNKALSKSLRKELDNLCSEIDYYINPPIMPGRMFSDPCAFDRKKDAMVYAKQKGFGFMAVECQWPISQNCTSCW